MQHYRLVNSSDIGTMCGIVSVVCNDNFTILQASANYYSMIGYSKQEIATLYNNGLIHLIYEEDVTYLMRMLNDGLKHETDLQFEYRIVKKDDSIAWHFVNAHVFDLEGEKAVDCVIVDITDSILATEKLQQVNKKLQSLTNSIPGGVAKIKFSNDLAEVIYANDAFLELLGYEDRSLYTKKKENLYNYIYTDDVNDIKCTLANQIKQSSLIRAEYRVVKNNNDVTWIIMKGNRVSDVDNCPAYQCVFIENTVSREAQLKLQIEKERFRIVTDLSEDIIFEFNLLTGELINTNHHSSNINYSAELINTKKKVEIFNIIHPKEMQAFENLCEDIVNGTKKFSYEIRIKGIDGIYEWYLVQGLTIYNNEESPIKVVGRVTNIDARKRETESLKKRAEMDPLTAIYNKGATKTLIDEYLMNSGKDKISALLMIDLDNFKKINDTKGHQFGDKVLVEISSAIRKRFREKDVVGRIGGDEFVVFIKKTYSKEIIQQKAEDISNIFRNCMMGDSRDFKISGSIGIAVYPTDGSNYDELLKNADNALYSAKEKGKDCFEFYNSDIIIENKLLLKEMGKEFIYNSVINDETLVSIFESLTKDADIKIAINHILAGLGKALDVGRIFILEEAIGNTCYNLTYEWCAEDVRPNMPLLQMIPSDYMGQYLSLFDEDEKIFLTSTKKLKEYPKLYETYQKTGTKATLQCAISDKGQCKLLFVVDEIRGKRDWIGVEKDAFMLMVKILSAHLLNLQAEKMFDYESKKIQEIIDRNLYMERLVNSDVLTGTLSLGKFKQDAKEILTEAKKSGVKYCILYTDFDKFSYINDTFGYHEGDRVLANFANKIKAMLGEGEIIARAAADNFIILVKCESEAELERRLRDFDMQAKYVQEYNGEVYKLILITGIYRVANDDIDVAAMIDRASMARKTMKGSHKSAFVFYDERIYQSVIKEKEIENSMNYALKNGQFLVYMQPKIDLATGEIAGAEALVRWKDPQRGIVPPSEFIPVFEKNGFIVNLDFFVFEEVCKIIRGWLDDKKKCVPVSINFSQLHIRNSNFKDRLISVVEKYQIPANYIEIEITESAFADNAKGFIGTMNELKEDGFSISMDDFGTGYSSLTVLKDFPFDTVKLDKSFFTTESNNQREKILISGIVNIAQSLDIKVVSEGVETQSQVNFLLDIGCDMAQGYLFSKPLPLEDFQKKLWDIL